MCGRCTNIFFRIKLLLFHGRYDTPPNQPLQSELDRRLTQLKRDVLESLGFYADIQAVLEDLETSSEDK